MVYPTEQLNSQINNMYEHDSIQNSITVSENETKIPEKK